MKLKMLTICAAIAAPGIAPNAQATVLYDQGFETDTAGWNDFGGTVNRVTSGTGGVTSSSGSHHGVLNIVDDGGAYTFGNPPSDPAHGNQFYFAPGFGTFTQSIDIYIDPNMGNEGDRWDMEVTLEDNAGDGGYGEFNFQAQKTADGYYIGRQVPTDPAKGQAVTTAGWYTFVSEWTEGSSELLDNHYILGPGGFALNLGEMAGPQPALDPLGATAGYSWIFGRDQSTLSLAIDNAKYEVSAGSTVPEPSSILLLGLGGVGLLSRLRKG